MRPNLFASSLFACLMVPAGCSSSDNSQTSSGAYTPAAFDLTGTCDGTASSSVFGVSNSFTAKIIQTNGNITGSITIAAANLNEAPIKGGVSGEDVTFGDISGAITLSGKATSQLPEMIELAGTYQYPQVQDNGTWTATCHPTSGATDSGTIPTDASATDTKPDTQEAGSPLCARVAVVPSSDAHDIAAIGDTIFLQDNSEGLKVIDVSDAFIPKVVGTLAIPGNSTSIGRNDAGDHVFMIGADDTLQVIDVSNHAAPVIVGSLKLYESSIPTPPAGGAGAVVVDGSTVYAFASSSAGLCVVDATDPTKPKLVGTCTTSVRDSFGAMLGASFIYSQSISELSVLNIGTPSSVVRVGGVDMQAIGFPGSLGMSGGTALLSTGEVVDVTNPVNPQIIATVKLEEEGWPLTPDDATVHLERGYLSEGQRIHVIDLKTPKVPKVLGYCETKESSSRGRIWATDNRLYRAESGKGLSVWELYAN